MPFKSKSQRRKFYALKSQGKMDQKTINEWEDKTPADIPERIKKASLFQQAFQKAANDALGSVININTGISSTDDINENSIKVDDGYFARDLLKLAGGPGSGVDYDNTLPINFLESSPIISIGYRKKFLEDYTPNRTDVEISVLKIKYKGQEKLVPKKLVQMMINWEEVKQKPIDVIIDNNGEYHIIDGHHRALAAILMKESTIKANIYPAPKESN